MSKVLQAIIGENDRSKPSFKVQLDKGEIVTIGNREMRLLYADELLDYYEMNIEWS